MKTEIRSFTVELRAAASFRLKGVAASYNVLSADLGGFRERIAPGAFARSLREGGDVTCLFNHDPSRILGRTKSATLNLEDWEGGLKFDCQLDEENSFHRDLYAMVKRGDISECSFSFSLPDNGDKWDVAEDERGQKFNRRTLLDVNLHDVSVVTTPAYNKPGSTVVDARAQAAQATSDAAIDAANRARCEALGREIENDIDARVARATAAVNADKEKGLI